MKQIEKTPRIRDLLAASTGEGTEIDALRVYEANAFNTLPIRKEHTLYKGARADRNFLLEMADRVNKESVPVQIQHNKEPLPIGRVFHGEVLDQGADSELRVLFFLDPTANEQAMKIETGSVDQVSVSVMSKQLLNSVSGFDYLGDDVDYEHIWSGTDNDGNQIGKNGVYARMVGLANWWEMSLVGQGGAQNARIVARDRSHFGDAYERLAASGINPSSLVLNATPSPKEPEMDLSTLVADLTSKTADLTNMQRDLDTANGQIVSLTATVTERDAAIVDLTARLTEATAVDVAAVNAYRDAAIAERDATLLNLKDAAKHVLAKAGKLDVALPEAASELSALITEHAIALTLTPGGKSRETVTDLPLTPSPRASAFRVAR